MAFITDIEITGNIYPEILSAITRDYPGIITEKINLAISETDGYINQEYDTAILWAQKGSARNPLIKNVVTDIALYHIHSVLEETPVIRRERYDYAKEILKEIRQGMRILEDIPRKTNTDNEVVTGVKYGSIDNRY